MADLSVLLTTEGTYPFVGGGVSTWCDALCGGLEDVDYTLYAVTGFPEVAYRYELPANVRSLVQVPLWGSFDPAEHLRPDLAGFRVLRRRKRATTRHVVESEFVPHLRSFVRQMHADTRDLEAGGDAVHRMWQYFQRFDWLESWNARPAWDAFVDESLRAHGERDAERGDEEPPSLYDLTTAMRWLRNYLLPLYAPVPETDLVHATIAAFAALPGIIAKRERGTPMVLTEHGVAIRERYISVSSSDFTPFEKRFLLRLSGLVARLSYHDADMVAPVTGFNSRWEDRYGVPSNRLQTIHNGVDPELFVPAPKPHEAKGRPTAVAAARVFPLKDVETMIRSAAVARESIPDVRYLVYGSLDADVPYTERCRGLIAELGLEGTFEFGGLHSRPSELYTEGDISVLSSVSEGFPYTVLESMACARPVVATDVGGVREALEGFGILVPARDPAALGEAVVTLLSDDELRAQLGRRAREQVLARYRIAQCVGSYSDLYRSLLSPPAR